MKDDKDFFNPHLTCLWVVVSKTVAVSPQDELVRESLTYPEICPSLQISCL